MTRIVINDASLLSQFETAPIGTPIYDPSGRKLGSYLPEEELPKPPYGIKLPISEQELNRRENEPGIPLAEFWKQMSRK